MVHDAEVARNNFVLQHGAGWNVDPVSVVSNDDDGALGGRGGGKLILKSFFFSFFTALLSIMMKDYKVKKKNVKGFSQQQNVIFEGQPMGVTVLPSNPFR